LAIALIALGGCKPRQRTLRFETLVQTETVRFSPDDKWPTRYTEMDLMVATDPAGAQQIADQLAGGPGFRFEEIMSVDYAQYFVVAAYFGLKPMTGYQIVIDQIIQTGQDVNVVVHTVEPLLGGAVQVAPIHAVQVRKSELRPKGRLDFKMWEGAQLFLTRSYVVS
jgi:hypothetical protein